MTQDITIQLSNTFNDAVARIVGFLPEFIAGLVVLIIGWIIASVLRTLVKKGLSAIKTEKWMHEVGIHDAGQQQTWVNIFSQIVFWTIFIIFLIPALEAWKLPGVTALISQLISYLPNVIAAVIIGFISFILAKIAGDLAGKAAQGYGTGTADVLSGLARYSILVFAALIILKQLGIAGNLIDIFFTALMAAFALGIGLSFGLGGRGVAEEWLRELRQKFRKQA